MTILKDSLDNRLENAKQLENKLREVKELIKVRKYESALTFLQASKAYRTTAKSHYGNSLYFKALADINLNTHQKEECEKACDSVYNNLVKAREKLNGEETGSDGEIEAYFSYFVEPSSIELWQDIVRYYSCLKKPTKALWSLSQLDIEVQKSSEFSASQTAIDKFNVTLQPFKIVFTAWGYNQLGNYQKALDLLQQISFSITDFRQDITSIIELLEMVNQYQESDSPSKHLTQSLLQDLQNNQKELSSKIKEQEQMFVESLEKNDFQIFINGLEKHKPFFISFFSNLRKVADEEFLPSESLGIFDTDKIYIPPLGVITFWQTGVSLLNLGEENRGRQLISSLKGVLAEGENKFYLQDAFERELLSLIQQS